MGLDITAYRGLTNMDCVFDADCEPINPTTREPLDGVMFYVNDDFQGRNGSVEHKVFYGAADSFGFCAGGYGGYNAWRNSLAELAGYGAVPVDRHNTGNVELRHDEAAWQVGGGPFWELINFSDCEGVIGTEVSAKLAADFAAFQEKADAHANEYFRSKYAEFRKAFEMAADCGAVQFH
jgi:hypothetical protein